MRHLEDFLPVLDRNGKSVSIPANISATFRQYIKGNQNDGMLSIKGEINIQNYTTDKLPPVHICNENLAPGQTSKALVMDSIRTFLNLKVEDMFLLDNEPSNLMDVTSGHAGNLPKFQAISSQSLALNTGSKKEDKKFRTTECHKVLQELKSRIMRHVNTLKPVEAKMPAKNVFPTQGSFFADSIASLAQSTTTQPVLPTTSASEEAPKATTHSKRFHNPNRHRANTDVTGAKAHRNYLKNKDKEFDEPRMGHN